MTDADHYQIQLSTASSFAVITHQGTAPGADSPTYTVPDGSDLPDAKYYWRVRGVTSVGVAGKWSVAWVITIDTTGPAMPVLTAPAMNAGTADTTPTFTWNAVSGAKGYHIQIADNPDFTNPVEGDPTTTSFTPLTPLGYKVYYWRVQAKDAYGNWGSYTSPANRFTATIHKLPKDGANTTALQPTFQWAALANAQEYIFELSRDAEFTDVVWPYIGTALSTKPGTALATGTYYWHVRVKVGGIYGDWMPTWTLIITSAKPVAPVLTTPASGAITNDSTPTLSWNGVTNGHTYQVQIDNNGTFTSPEQDVTVGVGPTSYIASELPDGVYSWRVRALNSVGAPGAWSTKRTFTIDTIPAGVPILVAPLDGASVTNPKLLLSWQAVTGATRYQLQLDTDPDFPLPVIDAGTALSYKSPTPLSRGVYSLARADGRPGGQRLGVERNPFVYPRRRANRARLHAGTDRFSWKLSQLLNRRSVSTSEPTVQPPVEPTIEPPTATPDPNLLIIESDDPQVQRAGDWTAHDTAQASGGRYLYSTGSDQDTLSLTFTGGRVDVIYVQHPALGSFVLELDGTVIQTVLSAGPEAFGARVSLNIGTGTHTLRILPVGVIAIDAFAVDSQVIAPPTPEPTIFPTDQPTSESTGEPTSEPTAESTGMPMPTPNGPLPILNMPLVDSCETDAGWQVSGEWRLDEQAGYHGRSWFADSTARGQTSTLIALVLLDLRAAQQPELRFWQRLTLSSSDLAAVDLSLDGGQTWQPLDTQPGSQTEWSQRIIDLTPYRGQIVRLRFRLETPGSVPEGAITGGWWIDELIVQEALVIPPTPEPTLTPLPTDTPTEPPTTTPEPMETPTDIPTATAIPTEPTAEPIVEPVGAT